MFESVGTPHFLEDMSKEIADDLTFLLLFTPFTNLYNRSSKLNHLVTGAVRVQMLGYI
jgi:hypothetical protein